MSSRNRHHKAVHSVAKFRRNLFIPLILLVLFCRCNPEKDRNNELARLNIRLDSLEKVYWKSPQTGLQMALEIQKDAAESGDSLGYARASLKIAGCYQMLDSSSASLYHYNTALRIASELGNDSLEARVRNGIANHYLRKEDYREAILQLTEALKVSERIQYKHVTGLIYNGLGLVYISLKKPDSAISCFERSRKICAERGDIANEAGIIMNIANCYAEKAEYAKALAEYSENFDVIEKTGDTAKIILAYINMGTLSRSLNLRAESHRNLNRALSLLNHFPDRSLLSTALLEMGTLFLIQDDAGKARHFLTRSLENSGGTLSRSNRMEALNRLSELEEKLGNSVKALDYFRQYTVLKDSIMNDETRKSVSEIQLKYDVSKKEFENELLNKKVEIRNRQNTSLTVVLLALVIIMVLTGVLIRMYFKNLKKNAILQKMHSIHLQQKMETDRRISELEQERLRSEIHSRNKELTTTSLQLISKNKLLGDIQKLGGDFLKNGQINQKSYEILQKIIDENLNIDKEWEQFKEVFENVHQHFFSGLKSACPELSENELRLCAYIRINLQNKEIARLLNVEPATIITARYRIRKKLNLDTKTVLEDFLRTF